MSTSTRFRPGVEGWVVRLRPHPPQRPSSSWWYGPASGWGTTHGRLDQFVPVWDRYDDAVADLALIYPEDDGRRYAIEPVERSVEVAIAEAESRRVDVLESDRDDRDSIADANDDVIAYLRGEKAVTA